MRGSAARPDIIVKRGEASCVIIETEWAPARTLEAEAESRLCVETDVGKPSAVLGVRVPRYLRESDDLEDGLETATYEYFVLTDDGRFPESGHLSGGMRDVVTAVRLTMTPRRDVESCVAEMADAVKRISGIIGGLRDSRLERMMSVINDDARGGDRQSWDMAALILLNAAIFQEELSNHIDVRSLDDCAALGAVTKESTIAAWEEIRVINYVTIFKSAIEILKMVPNGPANLILERARSAVSTITSLHVQKSGDVYGLLYQRMLRDRKNAAAFYTRPESATLLASLVMAGGRCDTAARIKKLRIADFACGTGMLLTAAYNHIINRTGADAGRLHGHIMRSVLYGYDIMPTAVHITASNLAGLFPSVIFPKSNIKKMKIGPSDAADGGYHLGSLDLISPLARLVEVGESVGGMGSEGDTAPSVPDGSMDYIVMNPPFVRNTNHAGGRQSPAPAFAVFGIEPADQRAMGRLNSTMYKGTCAHGNAGLASNFLAIADRALKPGGVMGLILPATIPTGYGWKGARRMIDENYDDVTLVMTVSKKHGDAFSADTGMHEMMLVARKRETPKKNAQRPRIKWALINRVPSNRLEAVELAKRITQTTPNRLEACMGGTSIMLGGARAGKMLDTRAGRDRWMAGRVLNVRLFQYAATMGERLDMAALGNVASMGLHVLDITGYKRGGAPRGPFNKVPYDENSGGHPCLWNNDKNGQRSMVVGPDCMLEAKADATRRHAESVLATATRAHVNLQVRYSTQRLVAAYTDQPTLGGTAWPNVILNDTKHEKAFTVWCNSVFGIATYWLAAGSQQAGRGRMSKTAFGSFPVLDFAKLTDEQLAGIDGIFDDMGDREFRAINRLDTDAARQELDRRLCGALGIDEDLPWLYRTIVRESQFARADL